MHTELHYHIDQLLSILVFFSVCTPTSPCQNGGTCDEVSDSCTCPTGYSGDLCDECELMECVFEYFHFMDCALTSVQISVICIGHTALHTYGIRMYVQSTVGLVTAQYSFFPNCILLHCMRK